MAPVLWIFLGILVILLTWGLWVPDGEGELGQALSNLSYQVAILLLALVVWWRARRPTDEPLLGRSFRLWDPGGLAVGLGAGLVDLALSVALILPLAWAFGEGGLELGIPPHLWTQLAVVAIGAPLVEELALRGVLWSALARFQSGWTLVLTTAALFALLHGLGGAYFFEFPTRFVGGIIFGWVRWRTGSLLPAVAAHFANNLVACFLV